MKIAKSGVLVIDKPAGISSAQALAKVKKVLGAKKAGHTGTLDPFATGVLICCINQATRLARFFLHSHKTYQAVLRLGVETDTQDATGQVLARKEVPVIPADQVQAVIKQFQGQQMQNPPVYAALKHGGVPLYKLARQGTPVQKPARPVNIKAIGVTAIELPDIHFEVSCSAGTYVRTLCADIGTTLGCGGHLIKLRRTVSSDFTIDQAVSLTALEAMDQQALKRQLVPMVDVLEKMPTFTAGHDVMHRVAHGQRLTTEQVPPASIHKPDSAYPADHVKVLDSEQNLKAVLKLNQDGTTYDYCCVFN